MCEYVATRVTCGDVTVQLRLSLEINLGGGGTVNDGTGVDTNRLADREVEKVA